MSDRIIAWWMAAGLALVATLGCVPQEVEGLTEPCAEACNETAQLGSPCAEALDCNTGQACNLGFPGGYCQAQCVQGAGVGDACGQDGQGRCLTRADGQGLACLLGCPADEVGSCTRGDLACYPVEGTEAGVCHLRCGSDEICGEQGGCDGQGLCRAAVQNCDGLTSSGCPTGLECYLNPGLVPFCGLPGLRQPGQSCSRVADCVEGHWCVEGSCRALCAVDDFSACANRPAACRALVQGFRLGFCRF